MSGKKNYAESFSREWALHKYGETTTWGQTVEQRKKDLLEHLDVKPKELKGKTILDAGCGNGELTMAMSDYGLKATGMDLSDSVFRAELKAKELGIDVKFVQGDVNNPRFPPESFDYVYSSGVLHHTPDTKKAFMSLQKMVRPGGKMWVWIYIRFGLYIGCKRRTIIKFRAHDIIRRVVSKLPGKLQNAICYLGLFLCICKNRKAVLVQWRDKAIFFHDSFTPRYVHRHTPEEIMSWFKEAGFRGMKITEKKHRGGIGIVGTKKSA